ncbi:FAD-dependent oxidoreductase [Arenibacter sp. GZD96]|uniref:FAD-dependent oxidoreductase n=1 Tax=Aurantibrevibacter litoralis TaxID=3106030 RepID=UPI002AFED912|nr:FAD-dependent oxidoreductase [Arenibacter sp. GZD-96]MEA1784811.1 FAD-dependent oxidoreductase [Arenibacter sp. GZD-96]
MKKICLVIVALLGICTSNSQEKVDVLIIGGGAGGTSAGIQAARMGVSVKILESTEWLGGMLTAAGVSAIDGNHEMPSGIWGEFRQHLYDYYGGASAVATGWVSHTLFEPSIGNQILKKMADLPNLQILYKTRYSDIAQHHQGWTVSYNQNGKKHTTEAKILIDATEIGELLPLVGADFRLGMDSKTDTGEEEAPEIANAIVQDITYVLILEDVKTSKGQKGLVKKPRNYNPKDFECACKREGGEMFGAVSDCVQMLNYGKLPNNKYMINWPNCGNDFYLDWPVLSAAERSEKLKEAKLFTQGFIYYIQNDLGFKNLRVSNEFPTPDHFPMIPYDREARRVRGKAFLTAEHMERPYDFHLYRTGVAVGDYPIDHHHDKNPEAPKINFINIKIPSYNIPLGALIPEKVPNFIVAEKNISVSNIANGATRLQPVVLGIGQAAGALAATSILENVKPADVSVRKVQQSLLEQKAYIMPFIDVKSDDPAFSSIQRIGATGILKGFGIPYKWANQTWFYPDRIVSEYEWLQGLLPYYPQIKNIQGSGAGITLRFMETVFLELDPTYQKAHTKRTWNPEEIGVTYNENTALDRKAVSVLTDKFLNPFALEIDFQGYLHSQP